MARQVCDYPVEKVLQILVGSHDPETPTDYLGYVADIAEVNGFDFHTQVRSGIVSPFEGFLRLCQAGYQAELFTGTDVLTITKSGLPGRLSVDAVPQSLIEFGFGIKI